MLQGASGFAAGLFFDIRWTHEVRRAWGGGPPLTGLVCGRVARDSDRSHPSLRSFQISGAREVWKMAKISSRSFLATKKIR